MSTSPGQLWNQGNGASNANFRVTPNQPSHFNTRPSRFWLRPGRDCTDTTHTSMCITNHVGQLNEEKSRDIQGKSDCILKSLREF